MWNIRNPVLATLSVLYVHNTLLQVGHQFLLDINCGPQRSFMGLGHFSLYAIMVPSIGFGA
jgi:hypothetical protein